MDESMWIGCPEIHSGNVTPEQMITIKSIENLVPQAQFTGKTILDAGNFISEFITTAVKLFNLPELSAEICQQG